MSVNVEPEADRILLTVPVRGRRNKNWWEPMFDPKAPDCFSCSEWSFANNRGPRHILFSAETLRDGPTFVIEGVVFHECDFQGVFERKLVFKSCKFIKCDFGLSTFRRTKFTNCQFEQSSFTQCVLENCELRSCEYQSTFISGNETQIPRTLISEPHDFIFGACAPVEHLPKEKSRFEQKARFEETRSTIARSLLANLHSEGSDETYYAAVKVAAISEDRARIARSLLKVRSAIKIKGSAGFLRRAISVMSGAIGALSAILGMVILFVMGSFNAWGSSISRAMIVGACTILAIAYRYNYRYEMPFDDSLTKATEVFFLFGYTNYAKMGQEDFQLVFLNALLGLFWYAIAIPTITNRLTRARG